MKRIDWDATVGLVGAGLIGLGLWMMIVEAFRAAAL